MLGRCCHPAGPDLQDAFIRRVTVLAGEAVDGFAEQVGVADVPGILLVVVDQDGPHARRLNDTK